MIQYKLINNPIMKNFPEVSHSHVLMLQIFCSSHGDCGSGLESSKCVLCDSVYPTNFDVYLLCVELYLHFPNTPS